MGNKNYILQNSDNNRDLQREHQSNILKFRDLCSACILYIVLLDLLA